MDIQYTRENAEEAAEIDAMGSTQRALKRAADIVMAIVGLVVLSPLFLLIAVRLKAQRNGPVIFRQERIGLGGRPFIIYKFRTMCDGAEADGPKLAGGGAGKAQTGFERFLRGHHLDELPQLWNVLRGDMSVVGPRPERAFFIHRIMERDPRYALLYRMRPGLTSDATLRNGYTDTMEKMLIRLDMDLNYLRTRSIAVDAGIIAATFKNLICCKDF